MKTQNMGGDIAGWSARQINASYDERDQISIFTVLYNKFRYKIAKILKTKRTYILLDSPEKDKVARSSDRSERLFLFK